MKGKMTMDAVAKTGSSNIQPKKQESKNKILEENPIFLRNVVILLSFGLTIYGRNIPNIIGKYPKTQTIPDRISVVPHPNIQLMKKSIHRAIHSDL